MSEYDKQDRECEDMQKRHGPGGELPPECYFSPAHKSCLVHTKKEENVVQEPVDASWSPVKGKPSEMDRVKACALSILPYAAMSGIVLWWQQTEQLVSETGFWALIVIGILGAFKVGRCCK